MTALNVLALVLSIVASIVGIVAHWRLRRIEKKLKITTYGNNSPVYIAGGDLNVFSISESFTIHQPNSVTLQPPIAAPPTTISH